MKHGPSLEDERQALLEQIHSSRAVYRRMLTQIDHPEPSSPTQLPAVRHLGGMPPDFPRSKTVQFVMKHPYLLGLGIAAAAAVVIAGPRRSAHTAFRSVRKAGASPATAKVGLAALTSAALRYQAQLRMAARAFAVGAEYFRRWQSDRHSSRR